MPGVKQRRRSRTGSAGSDPKDPRNFFAQFGVDPLYLSIYANDFDIIQFVKPQAELPMQPGVDPKLAGYYEDRTACVVGELGVDARLRRQAWGFTNWMMSKSLRRRWTGRADRPANCA